MLSDITYMQALQAYAVHLASQRWHLLQVSAGIADVQVLTKRIDVSPCTGHVYVAAA
jgi:hypothetical protein